MKAATREWVEKAEADYAAALVLRRSRKKHSRDIVCFHLQQCVEKYLRASKKMKSCCSEARGTGRSMLTFRSFF